jgi:hypothetical protein
MTGSGGLPSRMRVPSISDHDGVRTIARGYYEVLKYSAGSGSCSRPGRRCFIVWFERCVCVPENS